MRKVVALTGGIGSGKSTASAIFAALGVPVIDADIIARDLTTLKQPALARIIAHFGNKVVKPNGELDRAQLREIIFADPTAKQTLEQILHPLIRAEIIKQIHQQAAPYCLVVIPLLAEHFAEYAPLIDTVIVMDTPPEKQHAWAVARENADPAHIAQIMSHQIPQSERLKIADIRLKNDGDKNALKNHIEALHERFLTLQ